MALRTFAVFSNRHEYPFPLFFFLVIPKPTLSPHNEGLLFPLPGYPGKRLFSFVGLGSYLLYRRDESKIIQRLLFWVWFT